MNKHSKDKKKGNVPEISNAGHQRKKKTKGTNCHMETYKLSNTRKKLGERHIRQKEHWQLKIFNLQTYREKIIDKKEIT